MPISQPMRILASAWAQNRFWPKRLNWLEISGIRGWSGYRIDFSFPITAIVGENGSGKSTILQAAAASYKNALPGKQLFASDFFPDTPWDAVTNAYIKVGLKEGERFLETSVTKSSERWRGNHKRRERPVYYIDLRRIPPLSARSGYPKLTNRHLQESALREFSPDLLSRLSLIMGYTSVRMATAGESVYQEVVTERGEQAYSGFHQGAGEVCAIEMLAHNFEKYSLVVIDEIESSLHPRAQRRLIRDLAVLAREKEIQFIISTHSPYVLDEIVPEGRLLILDGGRGKTTVTGVSSDFAMTSIDDDKHAECDVYVEDCVSKILLREAVIHVDKSMAERIMITPFGKASVGSSLGIMIAEKRFAKPTVVFLDGDQRATPGVYVLPGNDAPEQVIFKALKERNWPDIAIRLGRVFSETIDILESAMFLQDHNMWLNNVSDQLFISSKALWHAMCTSWLKNCANETDIASITNPIYKALACKHS
ncbi:MAG: AAA family ATPase [Desulfovibrio sp.]|nr:AAA family ATPase [Desulfovibrio sp.]